MILGVTASSGVLPPSGLAGAALWAGVTYGIVRTSYAAVSRGREQQLARVTDELEDVMRCAASTASGAGARADAR